MKKLYVTSPLYYVNASPHIGHAYTEIICDTISRFQRQRGVEVFFMTGTDEHGEKIEKASLDAGFSQGEEKKFVDTIVPRFKETWKKLNIDYDYFIRTTDTLHEETVKKVLSILYENKKIYKNVYTGWFCTPCEAFWMEGQAPDGVCPDCKRRLEKLNEENYFFKISEYQNLLLEYIKSNPSFIIPEIRRNEVLSFLEKNKLQDLCISRPKKRMSWGIELPFDKEFVTYVWFDALINYISGAGYLDDRKRFDSLWPASCHVIGKDILRHHAIYWPIMLLAIGEKPPKHIFVHGWWVIGGEKMSKSKGNVVDPIEMADRYGVDALRYFLLSAVQFGYDGVFSEKLFVEKYNAALANDLGNLVNRVLTMIEKYFDGKIPPVDPDTKREFSAKIIPQDDLATITLVFADGNSWGALETIWDWINTANKYIEDVAPWKLATSDKNRLCIVINNLAEALAIISIYLWPFMPDTAANIWSQLGLKDDIKKIELPEVEKDFILSDIIPAGTKVHKAKPLFPRIK